MLLRAKCESQLYTIDPTTTTPAPTISLVKGNVVGYVGKSPPARTGQGYIIVQTSDERQHLAFAPHFELVQG